MAEKRIVITTLLLVGIIGGWYLLFSLKQNEDNTLVYTSTDSKEQSSLQSDQTANVISPEKVFGTIRSILQQGELDEEIINKEIDRQIIQTAQETPPLPDVFTKNDISTEENTTQSVREYANQIGSIFTTAFRDIQKGELALLREIANQENGASLDTFTAYSKTYQEALTALKDMSVPQSYLPHHVTLLNNFYHLSRINAAFSNFYENPMESTRAIQHYLYEVEVFQNFIIDITNNLKSDAITFSNNENGSVLFEMRNDLSPTQISSSP